MNTPQPAAAPDPTATANAQTASNKATAQTQYELGATNQVTPTGSLTYNQSGTFADGTPQFTATTALSPEQQQLYNTNTQSQQNLADIGVSQSSKIGDLLNTPFNTDTATADKIQGIQNEFLDPQWTKQQAALQTQLFNQGVRPGSDAYNTAMTNFSNQRQQGYDQSYLDSYNTGQQAALTQRNQPINEISALLSGSQVSQPNFAQTPTPGVAPTDVIGAQQQSLNQSNVGFNAQTATNNAMLSGLFGLGSAGLGGWAYGGFKGSDRRTKEDITRVGKTDDGLPIYTYRYKGGSLMEMGVMAQDVAKVKPEAIAVTPSGLMAVDYGQIAEAA